MLDRFRRYDHLWEVFAMRAVLIISPYVFIAFDLRLRFCDRITEALLMAVCFDFRCAFVLFVYHFSHCDRSPARGASHGPEQSANVEAKHTQT